jgi:hypothetical protein
MTGSLWCVGYESGSDIYRGEVVGRHHFGRGRGELDSVVEGSARWTGGGGAASAARGGR